MFTRSRHIAVQVPADQVAAARAYYRDLFGLAEGKVEDGSVELKGDNFTIWVDAATPEVVQEFNVKDGPGARAAIVASGATIVSETPVGFHVQDPYGLRYHVFIEE